MIISMFLQNEKTFAKLEMAKKVKREKNKRRYKISNTNVNKNVNDRNYLFRP